MSGGEMSDELRAEYRALRTEAVNTGRPAAVAALDAFVERLLSAREPLDFPAPCSKCGADPDEIEETR